MTEDYKKNLIDYITNLEPGQPTSAELFKEQVEVPRSVWKPFLPSGWHAFSISGLIKSKTSDKVIFYGGYVVKNGTYINDSRGIIIITDGELNPIQTIYEYSSGTLLRPIQCLFQEEDGQFVGIDSGILCVPEYATQDVYQALVSDTKRFIMINDISIPGDSGYQVNLRRSYSITGLYANFICKDIFKNPNSSHYAFTGVRIVNDGGTYAPDGSRIILLKIQVGSQNEWQIQDTDNDFIYGGANVYFDSSDNAKWRFLLSHSTGNFAIYVWEGTNNVVTNTQIIYDPDFRTYIDSGDYNNQVAFINNNKAYFVINNQRWGTSGTARPKYIGLFEIDFSNYSLSQKYLKYLGDYDFSNLDAMFLQAVNGELYIQYCDNVQGDANTRTANYYVQRYKGTWNPILIDENKPYGNAFRYFYVSQSFNLLRMNLIPVIMTTNMWYMKIITEIYNIANYNGEAYSNYNSLISKYGNIYSNDKIVFSRNLHNLSITNNYTVASVEVPNTYLNNLDLTLKELVGETNVVLVEDGKTITKNIYEVLYLNYINTISVKDNESNIVSATGRYINTNINVGTQTNYENTKCNKICVNYADNTNKIFPIKWDSIDDTHKSCEFTIYVDKNILNIEFISNDQTTTYITIERELEVGKYYTFKQYLKVE